MSELDIQEIFDLARDFGLRWDINQAEGRISFTGRVHCYFTLYGWPLIDKSILREQINYALANALI